MSNLQCQQLLAELKHEAATTKKMLALVPLDKSDWKPHAKSMPLGRLASHVAELSSWISPTLMYDTLDFAVNKYVPFVPSSTEDLLAFHDKNVADAEQGLNNFSDDRLNEMWTMRNGEQVYFTMPKGVVVRSFCFNHLVHHRAQLGVYLRMLDIALPGSYGPTADEG